MDEDRLDFIDSYESDLDWVQAQVDSFLETLPSGLSQVAQDYLQRLDRQRAQLEWHLPLWLGRTFGVPIAQSRRVALTNVLGMIYIRIHNDLMDADAHLTQQFELATLAPLLYTRCIKIFTTLFPADSSFWGHLERYLGEWAAALDWERQYHWHQARPYTQDEIEFVTAGKGSPIKIGFAAIALLAGRENDLPELEKIIDLRSAIAQIFDDLSDWREDWQQGRFNIFLTTALSEQQRQHQEQLTQQDILQAIYRSVDVMALMDWTKSYAEQVYVSTAQFQCLPLTLLCKKASQMAEQYRLAHQKGREKVLFQQLSRLAMAPANH
jgi:hypothetical protein